MNDLPPWVIWHIPHASTAIPAEFRDQFLLNDAELQAEAKLVADTGADELYLEPENFAIVFPMSRLVVDPERLCGDAEPMEKHGLGRIYRKTHDGRPLRRDLTQDEEQALLNIYNDHHAQLTDLVDRILWACGRCWILDGHTYPAEPLPFEDSDLARPPVCLGTDPKRTPDWLAPAFVDVFGEMGMLVELNTPYSGTLVPEKFKNDARVISVMIEIRKDCYSDQIRPAVVRAIDAAEMARRTRAALRLKERRQNHPWYGKRAAECRARGGEEAEMENWLRLQGSAMLAD